MNSSPQSAIASQQLRLLKQHRALILWCSVLGAAVAAAYTFLMPRTYAAEAALGISRSKIGDTLPSADTLSTANFRPLIESGAVAAQVIKDLHLDRSPFDVTLNNFFTDVVDIEEVRNSSVLLVRGRLEDASLVADMVNRVADLGTETAKRVSQQEARQAQQDLQVQLDEAKRRLDAAIKHLDETRTAVQLELLQRDVDAALEQRRNLLTLQMNIESEKARLAKAEQELASRQRLDVVKRSIDRDPALLEAARSDGTSKDVLSLQTTTEEVNPVYRDLDEEVATSRTDLAGLERQRAQMTARKLDQPQLPRLSEMYAKESEIAQLEMERDLAKTVYEQVSHSYESARLLVAGRSSGLQILTRAIPPDRSESRKTARNLLIGVLTGFLVSSFLVLAWGSRG
jgi:uncharacterized protein involved in exopolysaccharide biosynthesis